MPDDVLLLHIAVVQHRQHGLQIDIRLAIRQEIKHSTLQQFHLRLGVAAHVRTLRVRRAAEGLAQLVQLLLGLLQAADELFVGRVAGVDHGVADKVLLLLNQLRFSPLCVR